MWKRSANVPLATPASSVKLHHLLPPSRCHLSQERHHHRRLPTAEVSLREASQFTNRIFLQTTDFLINFSNWWRYNNGYIDDSCDYLLTNYFFSSE